ncbi:MAG: hypothetical protein PHP50_14050 [Lachnospiraceae bacterium]|nr:hypothetical protein [Lachnospiraceae bacterium]
MFEIRLDRISENLEKMKECRSRLMAVSQRLQETERSVQVLIPTDEVQKSLQEARELLEEQNIGLSRCICGLEHIMVCFRTTEEKAIGYSEGSGMAKITMEIGSQEVVRLDDSMVDLTVRFRE